MAAAPTCYQSASANVQLTYRLCRAIHRDQLNSWKQVKAPVNDDIRRIEDATVVGGWREVCETPAAWKLRRYECYDRARGVCENPACQRDAPWLVEEDDDRRHGHAHHLRTRGAGGAWRDDRLLNLRWLCWLCHWKWHNKKVLPKSNWRSELAAGLDELKRAREADERDRLNTG